MPPFKILIVSNVVLIEEVQIICEIFHCVEIQYVDIRTRNGKFGVVCSSHYNWYDILFSYVKKKIKYLIW